MYKIVKSFSYHCLNTNKLCTVKEGENHNDLSGLGKANLDSLIQRKIIMETKHEDELSNEDEEDEIEIKDNSTEAIETQDKPSDEVQKKGRPSKKVNINE